MSSQFTGKRVLVTGASAGLGREMARLLAAEDRANLLLVARRADRLEELAAELQGRYGIDVKVCVADLGTDAGVEATLHAAGKEHAVDAAILNAGITYFGKAIEQPWKDAEAIVRVNVLAVVRLATELAQTFVSKGKGELLIVSSLAGGQPMPYQAVYGGTKAFLNSWADAFAEELKGSGVTVSAFWPGGMGTEMLSTSGLERKFQVGQLGVMTAEECAHIALQGFRQGQRTIIPGRLNQVAAVASRLAPRGLLASQVERLYRGALPKR